MGGSNVAQQLFIGHEYVSFGHPFLLEILSLSITGRIFGHFTGRVHGPGCGLEGFLGLDFIIISEHFKIDNIIYLLF